MARLGALLRTKYSPLGAHIRVCCPSVCVERLCSTRIESGGDLWDEITVTVGDVVPW